MSIGVVAMLLGVFVVPTVLLWMGHRLRRRPERWQRAFWGGLIGHIVALVVGSLAAMIPPEEWSATDHLRGALAFWAFLVLPLAGGLIGAMRRRAIQSIGSQ